MPAFLALKAVWWNHVLKKSLLYIFFEINNDLNIRRGVTIKLITSKYEITNEYLHNAFWVCFRKRGMCLISLICVKNI